MLAYNPLHLSRLVELQTSCTWTHNWRISLGGLEYEFNYCFSAAHMCSIGFKWGDCACHSKTQNGCFPSHSWTILVVCMATLSCWKMTSSRLNPYASNVLHNSCSKIAMYPLAFKCHCIFYNDPTPLQVKQPQSIIEPPPCFTIWFTTCTWMFYLSSIQHQLLPSKLKQHILVSSLNTTCSQSLTVQSLCIWAKQNLSLMFFWLKASFLTFVKEDNPCYVNAFLKVLSHIFTPVSIRSTFDASVAVSTPPIVSSCEA